MSESHPASPGDVVSSKGGSYDIGRGSPERGRNPPIVDPPSGVWLEYAESEQREFVGD
jgi:hypothetical protein